MRLSIREEVAYNRIVTELIETAMAEAIAEVEMDNMLEEMEEYLEWNLGEDQTINKEITSPLEKEEKVEKVTSEKIEENEEVHKMLDDLERKLLSDYETQLVDEHQTPQKEDVHLEGKDVDKKTGDDNGTVTKLTEAKEPTRSKKHRHLSIFTKRRKTKPKVENEDISSTSPEEKAKKEKSLLKRFRDFLCCCFKTEK